MTALPTLGGTNATFGAINHWGQVAGIAETNRRDTDCPSAPEADGTGPYQFAFEAVIWGPLRGQIRALPPLAGDTVSLAMGLNDLGQVVGGSGTRANTSLPGFAGAPHAVVWDRGGKPQSLPNLDGSQPDLTVLGVGNVAMSINEHGTIAGHARLSDNQTWHPVLWRGGKISDLGVLPGDAVGAALSVNNEDEVVGASVTAPGPGSRQSASLRVAQWHHDRPQYRGRARFASVSLDGFSINDNGEIVGFGATDDGDLHAFLATPCHGNMCEGGKGRVPPHLSARARKILLE
jgi:probable HAF family extracellular repeat protein